VKSRSALGNLLTHYPIAHISMSQEGVSTLSAINVYYEEAVMRLNNDGRGILLGAFKEDDKILTVYKSGNYRIIGFDLSNHFDDDLGMIRKWNPNLRITLVYYQKKEDKYFMKRFAPDDMRKRVDFVPDDGDTTIIGISLDYLPQVKVVYREKKAEEDSEEIISCAEFVEVMSSKARGKRVNYPNIKKVVFIEPLPYEEPEEEPEEEEEEPEEEKNVENVDDAVAKVIFKDIKVEKTDKTPSPEDEGDQLSLF
jgi:topoisomerase-4 subunit A